MPELGFRDARAASVPLGSPLGPFELGDEILVEPADPTKPIVVASGPVVHKIYDMRYVGEIQGKRIRREASQAIALSDVQGVIRTRRAVEVASWMVIEMDRAADSLGTLLRKPGWHVPAHITAECIAQAAETLQALHRRGVVHRDVKPDNILIDADMSRPLIADFSVVAVEASDVTREGAAIGTQRYMAPEQRDGLSSPASDQYALAVTARDLLTKVGAPAVTAPVAAVIAKGTAHDAGERYHSIREFGAALRRAVAAESPRTLSERLMGVDPRWRYTWAPAALAALATYLEVLLGRNDTTIAFVEPLVYPVMAAALVALFVRWTSGARARRSRSASPILDQVWLPSVLVAGLLLVLKPILSVQGEPPSALILTVVFGPFVLLAQIGAFPRRTGAWLPRGLVAAKEALPAWLLRKRFAVPMSVVCLYALGMAPVWAQGIWPHEWSSRQGLYRAGAVRPVLDLRQRLTRGERGAACAVVDPGVGCGPWLDRHRQQLLSERRALSDGERRLRYTPSGNDRLEAWPGPNESLMPLGVPGRRLFAGSLARRKASSTAHLALVHGAPWDPDAEPRHFWRYILSHRHGQWLVRAVAFCSPRKSGPPCRSVTPAVAPGPERRS